MSGSTHEFRCRLEWTGARQGPTTSYRSYSRQYQVLVAGKPPLIGSAAPPFLGDGGLHNPEDLLVAALSACHFLSYAAECARLGVHLVDYSDEAWGVMAFDPERQVLAFREVVLRPRATVAAGSDLQLAHRLHERAHHQCFIASSVNFPVRNEPEIVEAAGP
jgi:organic hydroperoxide reductase OsmC/OhrA